MNVSDAVQMKRAIREFSDRPIPREAVLKILNAGRRAQSAKNSQPWHFIAIQDRSTLQELAELGTWAGHLAGAALGVVFLSPPFTQKFSIAFDLGQAAAYMQLAAWELGIGSVPATIYECDKARELLGFPPELETHLALSFGYPRDPGMLTRPPLKGGRQPLQEVVHWERWGGQLSTS